MESHSIREKYLQILRSPSPAGTQEMKCDIRIITDNKFDIFLLLTPLSLYLANTLRPVFTSYYLKIDRILLII